jgi:hypothetical protein
MSWLLQGGNGWRGDPGPCPVDDTPHTACTPEMFPGTVVAADGSVTIPLARPPGMPAPAPPAALPGEFTTKTYQRKVHGKSIGVKTR